MLCPLSENTCGPTIEAKHRDHYFAAGITKKAASDIKPLALFIAKERSSSGI
jgi:hypothetical protein